MPWVVVHPSEKLTAEHKIYIGCMTGTSIDAYADFTAACFTDEGKLIAYQNTAVTLPAELRAQLFGLSMQSATILTPDLRNACEAAYTEWLIQAYQTAIRRFGLSDLPASRLLLSPHGQTVHHAPNATPPISDQLVDGPYLAERLGVDVVYRHRPAVLAVSQAAPLAPVLLQSLFYSDKENTLLLNGGGIANICSLPKDQPDTVLGWDTGPANGILNELIHWICQHRLAVVPQAMQKKLIEQGFDSDGAWAASGCVLAPLRDALITHPYFHQASIAKSADRRDFPLSWVAQAIDLQTTDMADVLATVSDVIAWSISEALVKALPAEVRQQPTRLICYGGLIYHQAVMLRVKQACLMAYPLIRFIDMRELQFDPDYIESLLMAQLGYYVDTQQAVNLDYCKRPEITRASAVPGVLVKAASVVSGACMHDGG